jgi:uncharacterized surface protein with fasciclin (FAS1) repeats
MTRNITNRLSIGAAAAAVALALGSTSAHAQQPSAQQDRAQAAQDRAQAAQDRAQAAEDRAQAAEDRAQRAQDEAQTGQRRAQSSSSEPRSGDLAGLGEDHDDLSTFVKALESAGMIESLSDGTQYTIFAPTDEAFESMRGSTEELLSAENREELVDLLRAHIVADDVDAARARQLEQAKTLDGGTVELKVEGDQLMVDDATVVEADIERGSVRIHTIDEVLDGRTQTASVDRDERDPG